MDIDLIWVSGEGKYFCKRDWTGRSRLIRFNKLGFPSHRVGLDGSRACRQMQIWADRKRYNQSPWRDFRPDGVNIALIRANR
jgi:hypothetical protein